MATILWKGGALPVAQVNTVTIAGTWATSDTVTLTINGKDLIVTVAGSSTDDIAAQVAAAVNAGSATSNLQSTESRNFGGQEIPEFRDVVATSSGSVVSLTSRVKGTPFTQTSSDTATGTSVTAVATAATAVDGWPWRRRFCCSTRLRKERVADSWPVRNC